jgi:hypothetical protein
VQLGEVARDQGWITRCGEAKYSLRMQGQTELRTYARRQMQLAFSGHRLVQSGDVLSKLAHDLKCSNNSRDLWDYAKRGINVWVENCIEGGSTNAAVS